MAMRDYICCASCKTKVIYDGGFNGRNRLEENWGDPSKNCWTVSLYCPDCLRSVIADRDRLREALDNLLSACELPGEHCEIEQATPRARDALEGKP
jgi:hypothetical protein